MYMLNRPTTTWKDYSSSGVWTTPSRLRDESDVHVTYFLSGPRHHDRCFADPSPDRDGSFIVVHRH